MLKLEALAVVGFLILKSPLFRSKRLTHLQLDFDCPFLIFHTMIMNRLEGTVKLFGSQFALRIRRAGGIDWRFKRVSPRAPNGIL